MSPGVVPTIGHAFSCGAFLSAMHSSVVLHYRPCLLMWCLIISTACRCGSHYKPCLLAWYLTIDHACWSFATATDILLAESRWKKDGVWCYLYRGAIISDMSADTVPLSDMPACTVQLYQTYMLGSFIEIRKFVLLYQVRHLVC